MTYSADDRSMGTAILQDETVGEKGELCGVES